MTFNFKKCQFVISPGFVGLVTILLLLDTTGVMGYLLLAILLHESGHLVCMALFDCMPSKVCLYPFEINIAIRKLPATRWKHCLLICGGVLVNGCVAVVSGGTFQTVNIFLAVFHLLPLYSLDGYQLIKLFCDPIQSMARLPNLLSLFSIVLLSLAGGWMVCVHHNPLLLLFCLYLGLLQIRSQRHT